MTSSRPIPTLPADADGLERALEVIRAGGVTALPTDTLYGLCADALSTAAVKRVLTIKGRSEGRPIPVLVSDPSMLEKLVDDPGDERLTRAAALWPGPLTLVLTAREGLPPGVAGPDGSVGVRVPDHAFVRDLCRELGGPVTGTSANLTRTPPPHTAEEVQLVFRDAEELPDLLLDGGDCPGAVPSTVIDLRGEKPVVLRRGAKADAYIRALTS